MNKLLAVIYAISSVADFGFTIWGVALTSFEKEVNRIAQGILVSYGISGLFMYKFGGVLFVLVIIAMLAYISWSEPWIKHTVPALLLLGIVISLIGAWSWLPHILENM